jgi:hypothetical protein
MKFLFDLFRSRRSAQASAPQRVRLELEAMEERMVPSASSLDMHAVKDNFGSAVFYTKFGSTQNGLHEKDASGADHWLLSPGWYRSMSAGVDRSGRADLFLTGSDHSMWEHNSSGWHNLFAPETMTEFAAVKGDRVYAVGADRAMWEYSPPIYFGKFHFGGWQRLSGPGTVQYLDAVTQTSGIDSVFAIRQDGSLQKYSQGNWQWLATPNYFSVASSTFSAGLDTSGNADFFGLSASNGQLWRFTNASGWKALGGAHTAYWISATTNGQVAFVNRNDFSLQKFDGNGGLHTLSAVGQKYWEVSGAADNDVYADTFGDSLQERSAGGVFITWASNAF